MCHDDYCRAYRILIGAMGTLILLLAGVPALAGTGVKFDGTNDYITFGQAPSLGASTFTLELWFRRDGTGVTTTTGTGGVTAVPLLTKGRGEADGDTRDMNYFLGIRTTDNVLVADYEEGTGQTSPGLNHPVAGVTAIRNSTWYHACATFDGTTWRLYLNGNLETTLVVGTSRLPQSASIQHAGLATALTSAGAAAGYFQGMIDEARIWSAARSQQTILDSMGQEITSGTGLLGRWGLNEGSGTVAANSVSGGVDGTLTNGPTWDEGTPFVSAHALQLGASNAYVTFRNPAALGLGQFTIETWFRRDGTGTAITTGTGGITAIPLVTKGAAEADGSTVDMNYFLGIRSSDNVLAADFEEGSGGSSPGLNHPIVGVTPITNGVWYHAAATYDGAKWQLFLNGALENELVVGQPPQSQSIQHAGLGTSIKSDSTANGFFNGTLDEARIWNYARGEAAIDSMINEQIATSRYGLVARWALNEGAGAMIRGTAGTTIKGGVKGTGKSWVAPAPFNIVLNQDPPADPSNLVATAITCSQVHLTWTDNANNESHYEVERSATGIGGPYSLIATLGQNATSYEDFNREEYADYCYRVRATNQYGNSGYAGPYCMTTSSSAATGLDFGGTDGYATFGDPPALDLPRFTVETWFRRDGTGTTANTGTGGMLAIPLVTKGVGEAEASTVDMNYFLGIESTGNVIAADFEEGAGGSSPGLNHPVLGVTPIQMGVWYHAAATYDGSTWRLYLNGMLENELYVGQPVQSASIQHAGLGAALNSTGAKSGAFDGVLDEARIWDHDRTGSEIAADINAQITAPRTGLVARWGLNEGTGVYVNGTAGTSVLGTVTGTNWAWVPGAPFDLVINYPPDSPALVSPPDMATGVSTSPNLCVTVSDAESESLTVTFYGRPVTTSTGPDFTLIELPDTQNYTAQLSNGTNAIFKAQTNWIVQNRFSRNIVFVNEIGDIVNDGDTYLVEWERADTSMSALEDSSTTGLAEGIPFNVTVGNHEQIVPSGDTEPTTYYNQFFGEARFAGRSYYGGHYGANNNNHFCLFSASGIDFIVISMEYASTLPTAVLDWADSLLAAYPARRGIVTHHNLINTGSPGSWSTQGQAIYDALKDQPNLSLMLCGHVSGEGRRADTYQGNTVRTILADYQSRSNGGDGWLRIYRFQPRFNTIRVQTYSPTLDQFEADADSSSQFIVPYTMEVGAEWQQIGTSMRVASGGTACVPWPGRNPETEYEWYVTAADSSHTTTGPTWSFTTIGQVALTVNVIGGGTVTKLPDQPAYDLGAPVQLTAEPFLGYEFLEWSGDAGGNDNPLIVVMDAPKTITGTFRDSAVPTVQVIAPNSGETLTAGEQASLQWTAIDNVAVTTVDLLLSRTGAGGTYEGIASDQPNSGSYEWTVTEPATTDAFLKVVAHDLAGNIGEDLSDAAFTIAGSGTGVEEEVITCFELGVVSPNPMRGEVAISYALPSAAPVGLRVLDVQGREVAILANGIHSPGRHRVTWDGSTVRGRVPTGIYFLRMNVPGHVFTRRIVLAR
jgi:hypothetical protein